MRVGKANGPISEWISSSLKKSGRYEEFSEAGLLRGLGVRARRERTALLFRLARSGVPTSKLVKATEDGRLGYLVMRDALSPRGPKYTLEEISALAAVSLVDVERWFRAMGRGVSSRTALDYGAEDLRLARALLEYRQLGLDEKALFASARIIGRNLWAVADAIEALVDLRLTGAGDDSDIALRLASEVARLAEFQAGILAHLIANRLESGAVVDDDSGRAGSAGDLAVGFADLVGFTSLGEVALPAELAQLAERLDHLTTEAVESPVRFVKTVGDAVMLVSPDPDALVRSVLRIFDAAQAEYLPPLHAGVAWGPAMPKAGDWIGRTVNLASRITAVAKPRTILLDEEMHNRLDPLILRDSAGKFALKGYDAKRELFRLRPSADVPQPQTV